MKNWKMMLGILVAGVALSAVFMNIGNQGAKQGQGTPAGQQPAAGQQQALPQPGYPAPDFALKDLEGNTVKLSDLKGKRVLINFWASWCDPCRKEMPDLVKKSETYKDQIVFLGINLTNSDQDAQARQQFLQEFKVKYRNLLDEDGGVATAYQVVGIPTTVTVDPSGVVVDRLQGTMSEAMMERVIQNLLKK
ncbi:TlpA family protein disulfide reductase [Effusibacillus pohliae]|uniref:TlpA family protein disulfide reductase n=1 Tax=Effusibacillus pohliae TaxID=232270 RepID=UPI000365A323|nr:TlpA disulfide reductase family protein [Effusibacillus pohliae]